MHEIEQKQTHVFVYLLFCLRQYMSAFCVFQSLRYNIYRQKSGVYPKVPYTSPPDLMFQTHSIVPQENLRSVVWPLATVTDKPTYKHRQKQSELMIKCGGVSPRILLYVSFPGVFNPPCSCLTLIYILFRVFPAPVFPVSFLPLY
jgi:hypothetical protein